jgi:hypothetical protein
MSESSPSPSSSCPCSPCTPWLAFRTPPSPQKSRQDVSGARLALFQAWHPFAIGFHLQSLYTKWCSCSLVLATRSPYRLFVSPWLSVSRCPTTESASFTNRRWAYGRLASSWGCIGRRCIGRRLGGLGFSGGWSGSSCSCTGALNKPHGRTHCSLEADHQGKHGRMNE